MSLTRGLLLVLVTTGILASAPACKPTSLLLLGVKLRRRHHVLWWRNRVESALLICSPASAFGFLLMFPIRVEPGALLVPCFNTKANEVLLVFLHERAFK